MRRRTSAATAAIANVRSSITGTASGCAARIGSNACSGRLAGKGFDVLLDQETNEHANEQARPKTAEFMDVPR